MIGLTKTVAREFSARNILCNAVAPGFVASDMTAAIDPKYEAGILKNIPLGAHACSVCMKKGVPVTVVISNGVSSTQFLSWLAKMCCCVTLLFTVPCSVCHMHVTAGYQPDFMVCSHTSCKH